MSKSSRSRIVVPQRPIQGGFDVKFEADPYDVDLKGILTNEQYTDAITSINDKLRPSRSGAIDKALLGVGVLLVPLALWGIRHSNQNRRRKRLLKQAIDDFNSSNPTLLMRWNRRPQSCLTIERRTQDDTQQPIAQAQLLVEPGTGYAQPNYKDPITSQPATETAVLTTDGLV